MTKTLVFTISGALTEVSEVSAAGHALKILKELGYPTPARVNVRRVGYRKSDYVHSRVTAVVTAKFDDVDVLIWKALRK